jgi:hypothetical protein
MQSQAYLENRNIAVLVALEALVLAMLGTGTILWMTLYRYESATTTQTTQTTQTTIDLPNSINNTCATRSSY